MGLTTVSGAHRRQELDRAIVQGASLNKEVIWNKVLPELPLDDQTARIPLLANATSELSRIVTDLNAPGSDIPRLSPQIDKLDIATGRRKVEVPIPIEESMEHADVFALESFWSTQLGKVTLPLTIEKYAADELFNTSNFGSAVNSGVAYTAANLDTMKAVDDLSEGIERVLGKGEAPDTFIIPENVYNRIRRSKEMKEFVVSALGKGSEVNANSIQQAFADLGIRQVLIGRASYNSGAKGAYTQTRIWSNTYIWIGRAGIEQPELDGIPLLDGVGGTAFWKPFGMYAAETYQEPSKDQVVVRAKTSATPLITNKNGGTLINTQYA